MKRICLVLLSTLLVFSLSACKGNKDVVSSDTSSKITEKDIFEYNGTESEYKITESEAEQLFNNQSTITDSSETTTSGKEEQTSSDSESELSSDAVSSEESSSEVTSSDKYDKDGDGWTDDWK